MKLQWTFVIVLLNLAFFTESKEFIKDGSSPAEGDVLDTLLGDSIQQNGRETTEIRLAEVEATLLPMYEALPKATHQGAHVTAKVARYALHRYFEHRYGWFLRGLGDAGNSYDNSTQEASATQTLHHFLEESGEGPDGGVSLRSLAAVVFALEDIIFNDIHDLIKQTYTTIDLFQDLAIDPDLKIDRINLDRLVVSFMIAYISGADDFNVTESRIQEYRAFMVKNSKGWLDTEEWIRNTYVEAMLDMNYASDGVNDFHLRDVQRIVKKMIFLYNSFNDGECEKVKARLLTMEIKHTGRVNLADFYREGLSGTWEFNEKVEYLRDLGALDESKHRQPRVIVANYVSSWVNCMNSPKHYAICCHNPCEWIMDKLERQIQAPNAIPSQIMVFVKNMDIQGSNSSLSNLTLLEERLRHIAARHDGLVPLHGRLFAQWLHHATPRECPYPHETGTINPQSPSEWMEEKGLNDLKATEEEMLKYVSVGVNGGVTGSFRGTAKGVHRKDQAENDVPWSDVEELMVVRSVEPRDSPSHAGVSAFSDRIALLFEVLAVGTLVAAIIRASRSRGYRMWLKKRTMYSDKVVDA